LNPFQKEIAIAVQLVRQAAVATEEIRRQGIRAISKKDGSPVTQADLVSQAIILRGLKAWFPQDGISAEEEIGEGDKMALLEKGAWDLLKEPEIPDPESHLEAWVNYRGNPSGLRTWMIDPIDGTKGFKKGLSYAIAMGLYFHGRPQFGCIASPQFPNADGTERRTVIAYGAAGMGAYWLDPRYDQPLRIKIPLRRNLTELTVVGSRAHDRVNLCARFMEKAGIQKILRMDGQTKYLMVASGQADIYMNAADPVYGIGYPWDHCAGQAILEEAGGRVTSFSGAPLNYRQEAESPIKDAEGVLACGNQWHERVLELVRELRASNDG